MSLASTDVSAVHSPQFDCLIVAARSEGAVGEGSKVTDDVVVCIFEFPLLLALEPKAYLFVLGPGNYYSVGQAQYCGGVGVTFKGLLGLAGLDVPDLSGAVPAS